MPKIKTNKKSHTTQTRNPSARSRQTQTKKEGPRKKKLSRQARKRLEVKLFGAEISSSEEDNEKGSSPEEKKKELSNGAIRKKDKGSQKGRDERSEVNKITDERAQERERARQERKAKKENLDAFRHWEPSHEWPIKF